MMPLTGCDQIWSDHPQGGRSHELPDGPGVEPLNAGDEHMIRRARDVDCEDRVLFCFAFGA